MFPSKPGTPQNNPTPTKQGLNEHKADNVSQSTIRMSKPASFRLIHSAQTQVSVRSPYSLTSCSNSSADPYLGAGAHDRFPLLLPSSPPSKLPPNPDATRPRNPSHCRRRRRAAPLSWHPSRDPTGCSTAPSWTTSLPPTSPPRPQEASTGPRRCSRRCTLRRRPYPPPRLPTPGK